MFKQKPKKPTIFKRALLLGLPVVVLVFSFSTTMSQDKALAATSNTINFQARLLTAAGNVVPDGYYNVEFKLYKSLTPDGGETPIQGSCTTNPGAVADEDCAWTETRINADKVRIANGYLTVNLGSVTAFPAMNWDQQLWLSMNIGGTGSPSWDGEMTPRLKLTAVPYAFSSGKVVSDDGTGSATVANGDSGTICIQSSLNCGFVKNQANALQTATTNLKIQGNVTSDKTLAVQAAVGQTADIFEVQGASGGALLTVGTDSASLNQRLTITGTGLASDPSLIVKANSNMNDASTILEVQKFNGTSVLRVTGDGTLGVGNDTGLAGQLGVSNGTYFGQIQSTALTSYRTYELPNESGIFCLQGKVDCGFVETGSNSYIKNQQVTLQQSGFWVQGTDASKVSFIMQAPTASSSDIMQVLNGDATGGIAVTASGALNFIGTGTTTLTTPVGSNVPTKIKIAPYDPGSFGQILAFGLTSSAQTTARGIAIFDARTVSHQPTITVFSPNENQVFGLSWDGSNTAAALKTSSSQIVIRTGSTDVALFTSTGIDLYQDTSVASGKIFTVQGTLRASTLDAGAAGQNIEIGGTNALGINLNKTTAVTTGNLAIVSGSLQANTVDAYTGGGTLSIGTTNATGGISLKQNTVLDAGKSLTITGGNTASRPASPAEGTLYYDSTTMQLLVYANGKWQADRASASTKTVGMGATSGCTGSVPAASLNADGADYVVTSCTSAQTTINSAITALGSTGGTIYLMEGTYIVDGTINLATNVRIVGSGQATVLKFKNSSTTTLNMFTASSLSRIGLENLRLDGNKSNNGSAVSHVAVSLSTVGSGTGVSAVPGAAIKGVNIENFQGTGILLTTTANTTIADSYFGQNTVFAIDTNTSGSAINIENNTFHNNAIENLGSTHWNIVGNTFDGTSNGSYALDLSNSGNSLHTITGNTFINGNGMNVTGSQNVISGNTINTNNQVGINITGGANSITGNKVHDTSGSTFSRIVISGSNNTITGNDLTAGGGSGYAISIANIGAANNILSGNRFSGTGSNTINDNGKETIYNSQVTGANDIVLRGSAGLGLNTTTATASLTLQGAVKTTTLPSPGAPSVAKVGATGSATYTYAITANDGIGETLISSTTSATSAANPLTGSNYNRISWTRVGGAISYKIYRTAVTSGSPSSTGLIGTVNASTTTMQFDDTGIAATGSVPSANTTGGAYFAGGVTAANGMNIAYTTGDLFTIQGPSTTFVTVNAQNSKFYIGDASNCSGRFCVSQGVAGSGGSSYTNTYNYLNAPSTITTSSNFINQDIVVEDDSVVSAGTRNVNRGIRIDFTASSQAYSTYNGIYIKNASSTSTTSYGGNALQVDNGAVTTFRASNTGAVLVQNTVNSTALFDAKNAAGTTLLRVDSTNGSVNVGDPNAATGSAARITIGDTSCGSGGCIWLAEANATDSNVLQAHGSAGVAFSAGSTPKQFAYLESNGTFNVSDDWASQTKGYRFRTNGSGLDLQSTGVGVAGELWLSGYNTTDYSGTQVPFFRMSASSAAVFVGDFQTTSTPTLLVLSSKTTSATDPSGYAGAMYYNAYTARMRCYQNSSWSDCMGIPKPNTRKTMYHGTTALTPVFSAGGTVTMASPTAFSGYGDNLTLLGSGSSTVNFVTATAAGEPAHAEISTAATSGQAASMYTSSQYNANASPSMQFYGAPSRTTSYRMFVGMSDVSTIVNQTSSDGPSQHYAGFRASSSASSSGFWQCVSDNNTGSPTVTVTSVAVAAGVGHRFEVIINSGSNAIYKIDNVVVCTHTTKLPTTSGGNMRIIASLGVTNNTSAEMHASWLYAESNY